MAEILGVPISYFFGDLQPEDADISPEDRQWREQLQRPETIEFIRLYYAIPDQQVRRRLRAALIEWHEHLRLRLGRGGRTPLKGKAEEYLLLEVLGWAEGGPGPGP